jgi:hypothetical protein
MSSSKTGMTYLTAGRARLAILTAAILSVGLCGDATAGKGESYMYAHNFVFNGFVPQGIAGRTQFVYQQPVRSGPMRYYGGPKCPMWRGPVEN